MSLKGTLHPSSINNTSLLYWVDVGLRGVGGSALLRLAVFRWLCDLISCSDTWSPSGFCCRSSTVSVFKERRDLPPLRESSSPLAGEGSVCSHFRDNALRQVCVWILGLCCRPISAPSDLVQPQLYFTLTLSSTSTLSFPMSSLCLIGQHPLKPSPAFLTY